MWFKHSEIPHFMYVWFYLTSLLRWQNFHPFHLVKIPTQTRNNRITFCKKKKKNNCCKKHKNISRQDEQYVWIIYFNLSIIRPPSVLFRSRTWNFKCLKAEWSRVRSEALEFDWRTEVRYSSIRISKMQICLFSALWPKNKDNRHC